MNTKYPSVFVFQCFRWSLLMVFLGRALQHFLGQHPYRTLLWDEDWLGRFSHPFFTASRVELLGFSIGMYFLLCAILVFYNTFLQKYKVAKWGLYGGVFGLLFIAFLSFKDHFFQVPQLLEHSLQISSFFIFILLIQRFIYYKNINLIAKIALTLTFIAHGIYALGLLPTPVHFYEMTMNILQIGELEAELFLQIAGILDIIVSIFLWIPSVKILRFALVYMILWGTLTALARLVSAIGAGEWDILLQQGIPETLYRLCHALIPLGMYSLLLAQNKPLKIF